MDAPVSDSAGGAVDGPEVGRLQRSSAALNGVVTGAAALTATAASAVAGAYLAREFGKTAQTDGFFAAYSAYTVVVLGSSAFRVVAQPRLTRAAGAGKLAHEALSMALAIGCLALPIALLSVFAAGPLGNLLTGTAAAAGVATDALPWLGVAAAAQMSATLVASVLAAMDRYIASSMSLLLGSVSGAAFFVLAAGDHGIVALAWGLAINGAVSLGLPLLWIVLRHPESRRPSPPTQAPLSHVAELLEGASVPIALQALYLLSIAVAGHLAVGTATALSYAYLIASALVTATALSLSLVTSVPLTRRGIDAAGARRHVVSTTWLTLVIVVMAAGVFAVAGGSIAGRALGDAFTADSGDELGRLVVLFLPWMVAATGLAVSYPLLFIAGRARLLPVLAIGCLVLHVPMTLIGSALFEVDGVAVALGVTTLVLFGACLTLLSPGAVWQTVWALHQPVFQTVGAAVVAFGGASLVLPPLAAGAAGIVAYVVILLLTRSRGLEASWSYVRALR